MHKKVLPALGALAVGFLLVTNPVVADAAAKITSGDILDGTIRGVDVKDGTLRGVDFAPGVLAEGSRGPRGFSGDRGLTGPEGPAGPMGLRGPVGAQGTPGATGLTGPMGLRGQLGPKGDKGVKGDPGIQGPQGLVGPQGATGATGAQGAPGPQGAQGVQGPAGTITAYHASLASIDINDGSVVVLSKNVPTGAYVINAKATITNQDDNDTAFAGCSLSAGATGLDSASVALEEENFNIGSSQVIALQGVASGFGGAVTVSCNNTGDPDSSLIRITNVRLTAVQVSSIQ